MEDGDIFSGSVLSQNYFFDFNLFMSDTAGTGSLDEYCLFPHP